MIAAITGPLIVQPECWQVVFSRETSRRWVGWLALGEFKHVSAYAYVPFLHVWVFFDPHIGGTDLTLAAEGDPALAMVTSWIKNAAVVSVICKSSRKYANPMHSMHLLGHCVPTVRRLVRVPGSALSPTGFFKDCLAHGGVPLEADYGRPQVRPA